MITAQAKNFDKSLYGESHMSTSDFLYRTKKAGFGGDSAAINQRLDNSFNQLTNTEYDSCNYVNQIRVMRKPMKYYMNRVWTPSPTNDGRFSLFTAVGNQKAYDVRNNLTYPAIGKPTTLRNRKYITYVYPLKTSPALGANNINVTNVDIHSDQLGFGIGEVTNPRINPRQQLSATDYDRWDFVDPHIVQNVDNIIFANGVIPRGGMDSRNQLQNYTELNSC